MRFPRQLVCFEALCGEVLGEVSRTDLVAVGPHLCNTFNSENADLTGGACVSIPEQADALFEHPV